MVGQTMAHAAQDHELIGHLRELGQMLAKAHARDVCGNLFERAAMRCGCRRASCRKYRDGLVRPRGE